MQPQPTRNHFVCTTCGIEFPAKPSKRRRFCSQKCYHMSHPVEVRLWANVKKMTSGCWEWQGRKDRAGYGKLMVRGNRNYTAHRLAYEVSHGPFSQELMVCHTCDNPPCCNPDHLFVGTAKDNWEDAFKKGRAPVLDHRKSPRGEQARAARLTAEQVLQIRDQHKKNKTMHKDLARQFGVHRVTITDIIVRRTWKHLP